MPGQFFYSSARKTKIGILGGGQLASFLASAARAHECEVYVYVQSVEEPASSVADQVFVGKINDQKNMLSFFALCDLVLLESEFFAPDILQDISKQTSVSVYPGLNSYSLLFSKAKQKDFFKKIGIPHIPFHKITNQTDLTELGFEGPYMVKLSHGGYDGYGNFEVSDKAELLAKLPEITQNYGRTVLIEKMIKIKNEYASLLVKNSKSSVILPTCQTYQENSICKLVRFPATITKEQDQEICKIMETLNTHLIDTGIYAFEFFEDSEGQILINEAAPRVHNSYHFSMEAFSKSQFDLFLDAVMECELKRPKRKYDYVSMVNILGQSSGEGYTLNFPAIPGEFDLKIHLYGKKLCKAGRKMGHVTLFGNQENFDAAKILNKEYKI